MNDADDKLHDKVAMANVVVLVSCVINDDGKFYP